jgi:hypothetical protein
MLQARVTALENILQDVVLLVEALMNAMADERPLREPETSAAVLIAWDALTQFLDARRMSDDIP